MGPYGRKPLLIDGLNLFFPSPKLIGVNQAWNFLTENLEKFLRSKHAINAFLETVMNCLLTPELMLVLCLQAYQTLLNFIQR